ncbi:MAG: TraR/DksA family transcriptional regulator [Spirochaetia bacterium]
MTIEELQEIKGLISDKITELESSIPYLKSETQAIEPSISLGRLTRMEAISEKEVNEYVLAQNEKSLQRLKNALDRIEKGNYGKCVRCGKEIPIGRLRLMPEALICVPCKEKKA